MDNYNILPVNDIKEHEESQFCHCKPKVEKTLEGNKIIIHNSYDGREYFEKDKNKEMS